MKNRAKSLAAILAAGVLCLSPLLAAQENPGAALAHEARVTLEQARVIALKTFPGKILKEELERENGGSGLRYSFDIRNGKMIHEVGVDAKTGKVLENSDDSNAKD